MYPSQLCIKSDHSQDGLLKTLCVNEAGKTAHEEVSNMAVDIIAAAHCAIALMTACNEFFGAGPSSPQGLYYVAQTFALVRDILESKDALADSTLAIVLLLVIQEGIRKEHSNARVHYEGLRRMIQLRGGLSQLDHNIQLVLKICKQV